jgi:hypothetical protein
MAEKRFNSFVVTGDDDAKTTRVFFYIGSGKNRSAGAMQDNALAYYDQHFPETCFPEISNQRNYNEDPHEFNNLVQTALAENRAEYTRITNFGDRWVVTPKTEETPVENNEQATEDEQPIAGHFGKAGIPENEWYTPPQTLQGPGGVTINFDTQDDRVGLPDDSDDYEEEEIRAGEHEQGETYMEENYGDASREPAPSSFDENGSPVVEPGSEYIYPNTIQDHPFDDRATAELPELQAIGGFSIEDKGKAVDDGNKRKHQADSDELDTDELPTPEEMEEEARILREDPATQRRGNTGELRASDSCPLSPLSGSQTTVAL